MAGLDLALKNPLESRLGYQLRRASAVIMANLAVRLGELDLTVTEASVLVLVEANPEATQTGIGRALATKRANMVPLVAGLMDRRLIRREAMDGRSHALIVTEAGGKLARAIRSIMQAHEDFFFGELSAQETRRWRDRLQAVWTEA